MVDDHASSFKSFVWGKTDVIGAGATSLVYKAICQVKTKKFKKDLNLCLSRNRETIMQSKYSMIKQDLDQTLFNLESLTYCRE